MSQGYQFDVTVTSIFILCIEGQGEGDWNYISQNSFPHIVLATSASERNLHISW